MAETGTFQVTVNGFDVHLQTWDDMWNADGWADEVFINSQVVVSENGSTVSSGTKKSRTMGDVNGFPHRIQAGTATSHGGLIGDDRFPTDTPWRRSSPPLEDRLPMLVYQGPLTQDLTVAAITSSIWEYDLNGGTTLDNWLTWQTDIADTFSDRIKSNLPKPYQFWIDWTVLALDSLQRTAKKNVFGHPVSRPIGMQPDPNDPDTFVWPRQTLALTYDTANNIIASQPNGLGFGILAVDCLDIGIGNGSYTLYLQVERLDHPGGWRDVGHANGVTGLAYASGELWCSSGNQLWHRSAEPTEVNWEAISEANYVHAMAGQDDKLWCTNDNNILWARPAVAQAMRWAAISEANDVSALAYAGDKLWGIAHGFLWNRDAVEAAQPWTQVQTVAGVKAIAGAGDRLYAATSGGLLLSRSANPAGGLNWAQEQSNLPTGVVAMASDGGKRLWVATSANRLMELELQ